MRALAIDCAGAVIEAGKLPGVLDAQEDFEAWAERICLPDDEDWEVLNELFAGRYKRQPSDEESECFSAEWLIEAWDRGIVPGAPPMAHDTTEDELPEDCDGLSGLEEAAAELALFTALETGAGLLGAELGALLEQATPERLYAVKRELEREGLLGLDLARRLIVLTTLGRIQHAKEGA